jgi:thiamine biosynthesis lipoprotein
MGTVFTVSIIDEIDPKVTEETFAWFDHVEALFSTFRPDSQICAIERGELALDDADRDVRHVLAMCLEFEEDTGGRFSIRSNRPGGSRLDPAGYVKGWSVDEAALRLQAAGAVNFAIYAGGDVLCRGRPGDAEAWSVGLRLPQRPEHAGAALVMNEAAIASSGAYERGDHIWGPGDAGVGLLGATVVGPRLGTADALATAVFADQGQSFDWLARYPDYSTVLFTADGEIRWSESLDDCIEIGGLRRGLDRQPLTPTTTRTEAPGPPPAGGWPPGSA